MTTLRILLSFAFIDSSPMTSQDLMLKASTWDTTINDDVITKTEMVKWYISAKKWHNFLEIIFKSLSSLSDDALYSSVALTQFYAAVLLLIYNPKSWSINRRNLLPHKVYCHISQNIRILWIKLIKNTKIFFIQDFFTMWIAIIFLPQLSMDINNLHRG